MTSKQILTSIGSQMAGIVSDMDPMETDRRLCLLRELFEEENCDGDGPYEIQFTILMRNLFDSGYSDIVIAKVVCILIMSVEDCKKAMTK